MTVFEDFSPSVGPISEDYDESTEWELADEYETEDQLDELADKNKPCECERCSTRSELADEQLEVRPVPAGTRPPIRSTKTLRSAWSEYRCATNRMVTVKLFGKWNTPVNPKTIDAWRALETTLTAAGYDVHRAWVYVCRNIAGQKAASLHAYGLAIDIDHASPRCNVNNPTPDRRKVRFSTAATKLERCRDVQRGRADTAFTAEQVAAVEAIRTVDGHQVFAWGGRWPTTKDTMHFQINVTPQELARGIAPETVGSVALAGEFTPSEEFEAELGSEDESEGFESEAGSSHSFKGCTAAEKAQLIDVADRALVALRHAASFVGSAYGRPDRMSNATRQLLLEHFHTTKHDHLRFILTRLMRIAKAIEAGIRFRAVRQCAATPAGMVCGTAHNTMWFGGRGDVNVCFDSRPGHCNFATQPSDVPEKILIHEVAHRYVGIDDNAYRHVPAYHTLSPSKALDNADSYAFFAVEAVTSLSEAGEAWFEDEADTPSAITFTARTLPIRVSVLATKAARQASEVEVLVFAHGLDVCGPILKPRPETFITERPLNLGDLAEASGRPIVLIVPFLDWENLGKNKMGFGHKWHKLAQPENLNGVVAEALERVGAPAIQRLILAGHSRAFGVFDALARAHANPEMADGALSRLSHVWALDSTYTSPVTDWIAWLRSRNDLRITMIYRYGSYFSKKIQKDVSLSTGINGARFRAQMKKSGGRLAVIPVPASKVSHCALPSKYLPDLLSSLPSASSSEIEESPFHELEEDFDFADFDVSAGGEMFDDEWLELERDDEDEEDSSRECPESEASDFEDEDEPSMEAFAAFAGLEDEDEEAFDDEEVFDDEADVAELEEESPLESSGLTPAELKAVQITSTLETGKRGGFYGLSGNFDGYGISFGLVNWNIGTGSLQPLLRDFAASEPARWKTVFGPDATTFLALITPKGTDAVKDQLRFAIQQMNTWRIVKGKTKWSVKEPWVTYFKCLSEDPAFQRIQVRYVRKLLDRARYFCEYFGLKSEMSFAFMFDAVSSHGPWWLEKRWKNGIQKRRELLRPRLAALESSHGKGSIPERELLLAIADVLAETSSERWRDKVRRRKRWFATGQHPRAGELEGLTPRPDVPYQTSTPFAGEVPSRTSASRRAPMSDAERLKLVAAAYRQATTAGTEGDRQAIAATLKANGTDAKTWFGDIVPDATFLGQRIRASGGRALGVHRALYEVLKRAERSLLDANPGRTAEQLGKQMGIYDIAGLRPPKKATGGSLPSFHCFGLAVDINHDTNPFVGNMKPDKTSSRFAEFSTNRSPRMIGRAMWLIEGERFNVEGKELAKQLENLSAGKAWDIHHRASQTLAEYLRLADDLDGARLRELVTNAQLRGEKQNLDWWKCRIKTDRSVIKYWDFPDHKHPQKTGYMDLPRELVVALADAGLLWGGVYRTAKDIMHFDLRTGPIRHRPK